MHHTCKLLRTRSRVKTATPRPFLDLPGFPLPHTCLLAYIVFIKPILMSLHGCCLNVSSSGFRWAPCLIASSHITLCTETPERFALGAQPNPLDNPFPSFFFVLLVCENGFARHADWKCSSLFVWIIALMEAFLSLGTFHTQCPRISWILFKKFFFI